MTAAKWIESCGVQVTAEGDSLRLVGLASLTPGQAAEVLAFARQNKTRLLEELGAQVDCRGCGKPFTPSDPNKVYCCAKCFSTARGVLQ